jgi:hypothetical protein
VRDVTGEGLRAIGICCAVATAASLIGVIMSVWLEAARALKWSGGALFASILIPPVAMRWHLAVTDTLTQRQKRRWRDVGSFGLNGFIASYFYLMRSDRRLEE